MSKFFYMTTPLYYINAKPHLGHAYTTIVADVARRFQMMIGKKTFFATGTDEHGDKIVRTALRLGKTPKEYVGIASDFFKNLWVDLNISNDRFIRTTDSSHIALVSMILKRIYDFGDVYFDKYSGLYCFDCERFYSERELINGKCPDHGKRPEIVEESNYFFRMSKYQNWLIEHINKNSNFIQPENYKKEVLSFLSEPLEDLCISRPKSRINWGVDLPFDKDYITYVWFDALLGYISVLGYPNKDDYNTYWPYSHHLVAKDILKPHGIYWPIMLKAARIPIYKSLNVHGYWKIDQKKMSKSIGNVVEPLGMVKKYGLDEFRYFLMREMVFGLDATFSENALINRVNSDLANDLGNLFSRVLSMFHKYMNGVVPEIDNKDVEELELELQRYAQKTICAFEDAMVKIEFHNGLISIWKFIAKMNKYINVVAPWMLLKSESGRKKLNIVMCNLLEGLRVIAGLVYPIMPDSSKKMQYGLGIDTKDGFLNIDELKVLWYIKPGVKIPKIGYIFPRIEKKL